MTRERDRDLRAVRVAVEDAATGVVAAQAAGLGLKALLPCDRDEEASQLRREIAANADPETMLVARSRAVLAFVDDQPYCVVVTSPLPAVQPVEGQDSRQFPPVPVPPSGRPPRKHMTWLVVLVTAAVMMALVAVGVCGYGGIRLFSNLKHVVDVEKEVRDVTAAFIEDSRDGLSQAGYDGLCAEAKEQFPRKYLAAPQQGSKTIVDYHITSTSLDYLRQTTVEVEVERADGSTAEETYILREEGKRWKMCIFPR